MKSEKELQNAILDFLQLQPFVEAWQTDPARTKGRKCGGKYRPKGIPDIVGFLQGGRAFFLECKKMPNVATPEQREFLLKANRFGTLAAIVYSLDDVISVLQREGYLAR